MFKVGDEVLINGEVVEVMDAVPYPTKVKLGKGEDAYVFSNDEVCYADKIVKTYEMGLNDAWQLAKKIATETKDGGIPCDDMCVMFGTDVIPTIFANFTFEDCRDKIEAYENEKSKIEVGSVVKSCAGGFGIVTRIEHDKYYVVWCDGSCNSYEKGRLTNTGKMEESLKSLLRQIGE